jgi:hypothetical protein
MTESIAQYTRSDIEKSVSAKLTDEQWIVLCDNVDLENIDSPDGLILSEIKNAFANIDVLVEDYHYWNKKLQDANPEQ